MIMNKVYNRIESITGNVITVKASGVQYKELAQINTRFGKSLAQVNKIEGDVVSLQVFAGGQAAPPPRLPLLTGPAPGVLPPSPWLPGEPVTGLWAEQVLRGTHGRRSVPPPRGLDSRPHDSTNMPMTLGSQCSWDVLECSHLGVGRLKQSHTHVFSAGPPEPRHQR